MQLQQLLPRPTDLVYVYTRGIHLLKIMEMIQSPILLFAYKQWGLAKTTNGVYRTDTLPISFSKTVFRCVTTMVGNSSDTSTVTVIWNDQQTTLRQVQFRLNGTATGSPVYFIVGR